MVKLQKPTPKNLDKKKNIEMKPKLTKVQKAKTGNSSKVQKSKKSALAVKEESKKSQKQHVKKELIAKIVQQPQEVVVPSKKVKNVAPGKQEKVNIKQKSAKKPLILAPPESPVPPASKPTENVNPKALGAKLKKEKKSNTNGAVAPVGKIKKGTVAPAGKGKKSIKAPVGKVKKGAVPAKANKSTNANKVGKKTQKPIKGVPLGPKTKSQVSRDNKRTFQKNERVKKQMPEKTGKKEKSKQSIIKYEPLPFDEEKFKEIINVANVKKVSEALNTTVEKEVANKKTSIFSDYKYILNIATFKIADCPKRMVKLKVKHSLVDKDDDVVIIVPDLHRGAKADYEPTKQHYEDILREAGVEGLTVMPFNQLRTECNTFEAVRKFSNTYDYFLCDGRVVGHANGFCGKTFQKPRTALHAVRLTDPSTIKSEIEKSLLKTGFRQLMKGNLTSIPVGTHKHTTQQLAENVICVVEQLKTLFPGGVENIRNIHLKIDVTGTSALPIYISMAQPPEKTPFVVGPREQRMLKMRKDANDVLSKFALTKDASLLKLNKVQIERKRKLQEAQKVLKAEAGKTANGATDERKPSKKARKEDEESSKKATKDVKSIEEESEDDDEDEDEEVLEGDDDTEASNDDDLDDDDEEDDDEDEEDEDSEA